MRRRYLAGAFLALVALLVAALVAFGAWLLTTEGGRDFALKHAEALLPVGSSLGEADGVLVGPLTLRDVTLIAEDTRIDIEQIDFSWSLGPLWAGRIQVDELAAVGIDIHLPEPANEDAEEPRAREDIELPTDLSLPFPVRVERLTVSALSVHTGGDTLGRFDLGLRADHDGSRLRLDDLQITTPWGEASGRVRAGAAQPYPLAGHIDWRTQALAELPAMQGTLDVGGTPAELALDLATRKPGVARLGGVVRALTGEPSWDLTAVVSETAPGVWHADAPAWPVTARVTAEGNLAATRVRGNIGLARTPLAGIDVQLDAELGPEDLTLESLLVRLPASGASAEVTGNADWRDGNPRVDFALTWQNLAWPLVEPAAVSPEGRLQVVGGLDGYSVEGTLRGGPVVAPDGDWRVALAGDDQAIERWQVDGDWLDATWAAAGDLAWRDVLQGDLELAMDGLDPGRVGGPVAGRVNVDTRAAWRLTADGLVADMAITHIGGSLEEQPLSGGGRISIAGERIELHDLALQAGAAKLEMDGKAAPEPDLQVRARIDDLARLLPEAAGSLQADGRIHGALPRPGIDLALSGRELAWQGTRIDAVDLEARLPTELDTAAVLDASVTGLERDGQRLDEVTLRLDGTLADHTLDLRVRRMRDTVHAGLVGGIDEFTAWSGEIRRLDLLPRDHTAWVLAESAALSVDADAARLDRLCLTPLDFTAGRACLDASWARAMGWQAAARLQDLPLAPWLQRVAPDLHVSGSLQGGLRASGGGEDGLAFGGRVELSPGRIAVAEDNGDEDGVEEELLELMAWRATHADLEGGDDEVRVQLDMPLAPSGIIALDLRSGLGEDDQPLSGRLRIESDQLPLLARLSPEVGRIEGRVDVGLDIAGTREQPLAEGTAELADGLVTLPRIGLRLTDVSADFSAETRGLRLQLGARSRDGRIDLEALARRREAGWKVDGTLAGESFRAIDTPDARVDISPDLEWRVANREVHVQGRIDVPWARITPRDLGGAVQPTADLERVGVNGEAQTSDAPGWRVFTDIEATLGDDVRFRGFGLRGRLGGGLRLRDEPGELTTARGEIEVRDGTYSAYQQELTIERGRLIYTGNVVTDPGLDIRAVRRPRNVLVGVRVRGTLQQPDVTLFSEPPMQQSQILSYLIIGMPVGEAGDDDRSALAGAVAGAGGWVAGQVGGGLGIDDVSVEEGATQGETELVLGTYLHPRLYVSYGVGLFESFSRVRMRYSLGSNWAVEGESGPSSSGDLLYSIER